MWESHVNNGILSWTFLNTNKEVYATTKTWTLIIYANKK